MEFLTKRPGVPTGRTKKQMLGGGGGGGGSKKISIKQALKKIVEKKELPNNEWQLKNGSSCCAVDYLPEPVNA